MNNNKKLIRKVSHYIRLKKLIRKYEIEQKRNETILNRAFYMKIDNYERKRSITEKNGKIK